MRKTLLYVMGALLMALLPVNVAQGQNKEVRLQVNTLNRAAVTEATIYAATSGTNYFVDSAHLATTWTAEATPVSSLAVSTVLTLDVSGEYVGLVDSTTYATSFIVIKDAGGVYYMVGDATNAAQGIVAPTTLFDGVSVVTGPISALMGAAAVVTDEAGNGYTTLANAVSACDADAILDFADTVTLTSALIINKSLTIDQNGFPMYATTGQTNAITVNQWATVSWTGDDDSIVATDNVLFYVANADLSLNGVIASGKVIAQVISGASLSVANATLSAGADKSAIQMAADAYVNIDTVTFEQGLNGVYMYSNATEFFTIKDYTVDNLMSGVTNITNARAYIKSGVVRAYHPTIKAAVAGAMLSDTVYMADTIVGGTFDTIAAPVVLNLNTYQHNGTLVFANSADTCFLVNGFANAVNGAETGAGVVVIDADTVVSLTTGAHPMVVNGGDVAVVNGNTATATLNDGRFSTLQGNVLINGGKYTETHTSMLAPRHCFVDNEDADAAEYPYTVAEGFQVTYVNWNYMGQDTLITYNTANNLITPVFAAPSSLYTDTLFIAWYKDTALTIPWMYMQDTLTSDTTLYARWMTFDDATQAKFTTEHYKVGIDAADSVLVSSATTINVIDFNTAFVVAPYSFEGFLIPDTIHCAGLTADTTFKFYYVRDTFDITWNFLGGEPEGTYSTRLAYGDTIVYPDTVARPGHVFTGWSSTRTTMPAYDININARYDAVVFDVTWTGADTVTYTAEAITGIAATYSEADSTIDAVITITDVNGDTVSEAVNVGVYTLTASAVDPVNYALNDSTITKTLTIVPAEVSVSGVVVETTKTYDGTDVAEVTDNGTTTGVLGNDDVAVLISAAYDTPDTGDNKTITAHFTMTGADIANYVLAATDSVMTTTGVILPPMVLDVDTADNGIVVDAEGYCGGDAAGIQYILESGNPVDYKLVFDSAARAQGFTDVPWTAITTPGQLTLTIPTDAATGTYAVDMYLRNVIGDSTNAITIYFHVNLNKNYVRPLFDDVIAVVDTCDCISNIQWYEDGVAVPGATGYYYQPGHDLAGHTYHVTATIATGNTTVTTSTCEQDDVATYVEEAVQTTVTVYPNPAATTATIELQNATSDVHTIRVMNMVGVTLMDTTFEGNVMSLDLSDYNQGSYTVSVDGVVVRVIKK